MTSKQRAVLLSLAALTVIIAVVIASSSGGSSDDDEAVIDTRTDSAETGAATPAATETTPVKPRPKPEPDTTVDFKDGESVEGVEKLRYRKGSTITFTVTSDVDESVHLHGYDVAKQVKAGGRVRFAVPAEVEGRFELEMERSAAEVARIEVLP